MRGIGKATLTRTNSAGNKGFKVRGQMKRIECYPANTQQTETESVEGSG